MKELMPYLFYSVLIGLTMSAFVLKALLYLQKSA